MVTYREGLSPIKSHNPLKTWSQEVKRQIKNVKSPTAKDLGHQTRQGSDKTLGAPTHDIA